MNYLFVFLLIGFGSSILAQAKKQYYDNGQLKWESNWKDGVVDGVCRGFYENGQQRSEQNFIKGKRNGIERKWYKNGQLEYEWNYKADTLWVGTQKWWYDNGQIHIEENYRADGKQDGVKRVWHENGKLKQRMIYEGGEAKSEKCWDENSNELDCEE